MGIDTIANALIHIKNSDLANKKECIINTAPKMLAEILKIMKKLNYIDNFEIIEEGNKKIYKVKLAGKINECKAIKPRYAVKKDEFEKYEKRYLPARDIGTIIVSTSQGLMTHREAKEKGIGGRLIAYIY
ncbi:MAG: 30S ribosomal protein S8 [Candidatus Diapherotrites archaeon]|nr:30S ribosomal protein S8 [Candidatus Diapherotrites archaeon]